MAAIEDETLLQATTDSDFGFGPAPKALTGLALMGTSAELMRRQTPGGVRRLYADYASNYLNNFYKKNPLLGRKAHQGTKYIWEGVKTGGRIARDATSGFTTTEFYNRTGVSPTLIKNIKDMEVVKDMANQKYLDGKITKTEAIGEIKKAQKVSFFKASSDKANRMIFFGKSSSELDRIVGDSVKLSSKDDFVKSVGGKYGRDKKAIADYVFQRQTDLTKPNWKRGWGLKNLDYVDKNNLKFIKYSHLNFADVLRGAQFDKNMYKSMLALKNLRGIKGDVSPALNALKGLGIHNAQSIGKHRVAFSISPSIKPNYDWGGYNSVAIWDKRYPDKIRFIATDVPNTPGPSTGGKVPGLKYVQSKEVTINAKNIKEIFQHGEVNPERRAAALKGWETRRANGWVPKTSKLGPRQIGDLGHNSVIGNSRYQELKNLNSKRAGFHISNARRFAKIGRRLPGAIGIALNAWALYDTFTNRDN